MTEKIRQAFETSLGLYIDVVKTFHFFEGLTQEQWTRYYNQEELSESEKELVQGWDNLYDDPSDPLNIIHNYLYTLTETGRLADLPTELEGIDTGLVEELITLINRWNRN